MAADNSEFMYGDLLLFLFMVTPKAVLKSLSCVSDIMVIFCKQILSQNKSLPLTFFLSIFCNSREINRTIDFLAAALEWLPVVSSPIDLPRELGPASFSTTFRGFSINSQHREPQRCLRPSYNACTQETSLRPREVEKSDEDASLYTSTVCA